MAAAKGRGRGEAKDSPRRISAKEKQAIALRLRANGASYQQIADELGYKGPTGARQAIESAMAAIITEPAEEYRTMQRLRYEGVIRAYAPGVLAGNARAGEVYLRACELLAKLDGLDAPKKIHDVTPLYEEIRAKAVARGLSVEDAERIAKQAITEAAASK